VTVSPAAATDAIVARTRATTLNCILTVGYLPGVWMEARLKIFEGIGVAG
jgi:hypothetical protein